MFVAAVAVVAGGVEFADDGDAVSVDAGGCGDWGAEKAANFVRMAAMELSVRDYLLPIASLDCIALD